MISVNGDPRGVCRGKRGVRKRERGGAGGGERKAEREGSSREMLMDAGVGVWGGGMTGWLILATKRKDGNRRRGE